MGHVSRHVDLEIPKQLKETHFPDRLLQPRRRAELALVQDGRASCAGWWHGAKAA